MEKWKPSRLMMKVLRDVASGNGTHQDCRGRSEYGGRARCFSAMLRRGLLRWDGEGHLRIGEAGLKLLVDDSIDESIREIRRERRHRVR